MLGVALHLRIWLTPLRYMPITAQHGNRLLISNTSDSVTPSSVFSGNPYEVDLSTSRKFSRSRCLPGLAPVIVQACRGIADDGTSYLAAYWPENRRNECTTGSFVFVPSPLFKLLSPIFLFTIVVNCNVHTYIYTYDIAWNESIWCALKVLLAPYIGLTPNAH